MSLRFLLLVFLFGITYPALAFSFPLFESTPENISIVLPYDSLGLTTSTLGANGVTLRLDTTGSGAPDNLYYGTVLYRAQGETAWKTGHPLLRTSYENAATHIGLFLSTSLFNLRPDTAYEISIAVRKQDNSVVSLTRTVRTRPDRWSSGGRNLYVNAAAGNDGNSGLSATEAKQSISAIVKIGLNPGDRVHIANGRYFEEVFLDSINGLADNDILFQGEGDSVFLEGYDSSFHPAAWESAGADSAGNPVFKSALSLCPDGGWMTGTGRPEMEGMLFQYHATNTIAGCTLADLYANVSTVNRLGAFYHDSLNAAVYLAVAKGFSPDTLRILFSSRKTCIRARYSSHLVFRNLNIEHGGYYGLSLEGCSDIRVTRSNFKYHKSAVCTNHGIPNFSSKKRCYVWKGDTTCYWDATIDTTLDRQLSHNCIVESCLMSAPKAWAWNNSNNWEFMHDNEFTYARHHLNGIDASYAGTGWVVRFCRFQDLFNGFYISQNGERNGLWDPRFFRNLDFHDNTMVQIADDCIEPEGTAVNLRIYRNRLNYFRNGLSDAPTTVGPFFFFRNTVSNWIEGAVKAKDSWDVDRGVACLYHNTFFIGDDHFTHGAVVNGDADYNDIYLNNIMSGSVSVYNGGEGISLSQNTLLDYNSDYCFYGRNFILLTDGSFINIDQARLKGLELHGFFNTSSKKPVFVDSVVDTPNVELSWNSIEIDHGVRIPGINDNFLGDAPDIGALEWDPAIAIEQKKVLTGSYRIYARPNPFSSNVLLGFARPEGAECSGIVTLRIYNIAGQELFSRRFTENPQICRAVWAAAESRSSPAAGVYLVRWSWADHSLTQPLTLIK